MFYILFFFFNDTATTEIYTLSLHDALPIYDLVDDEAHRASLVGEHQDRLRARGLHRDAFHLHQRHQLIAVLHHVAAIGDLDLVGRDLLQPRDERQRHRSEERRV